MFVCWCASCFSISLLSLQLFYRFESFLTAGEIYYCDLKVSPITPTVSCNGTFFNDRNDLRDTVKSVNYSHKRQKPKMIQMQ